MEESGKKPEAEVGSEEHIPRTLRDVWKYERRLTTAQAAHHTGLSPSTLYALNRKEDAYFSTVIQACRGLGITLEEYVLLDSCPHADSYDSEGNEKT